MQETVRPVVGVVQLNPLLRDIYGGIVTTTVSPE